MKQMVKKALGKVLNALFMDWFCYYSCSFTAADPHLGFLRISLAIYI